MTALVVMKIMIELGKSLNELSDGLELIPQFNCNIETDLQELSNNLITKISEEENSKLKNGRVLVRKSGTEPVLRITVESTKETRANELIDSIKTQINQA